MYARIIRNDIRRSRLASLATALFVAVSALLVSLAGALGAELSAALELLMERAATPHLLQMHSGPIDLPRLESFAAGRPEVEGFQVLEFLNVEGFSFELGTAPWPEASRTTGFRSRAGVSTSSWTWMET